MKLRVALMVVLCLAVVLVQDSPVALAQGDAPPVVDILGRPDTLSHPPLAFLAVSVVDRKSGRIIEGLDASNFDVRVSEEAVEPTVKLNSTGLAAVMVIDRGGIARSNDPRMGYAVDLASTLLGLLSLDGSPNADMAALIGIRGQDAGGLTPLVPFTDYDPVAISNEFDALRTEVVDETTPLYEGIDRAISWIVENPDASIQDKLADRRCVIFVFSDGIDRDFSDESHEALIVDRANKNDVLIYAVQMTTEGRTTESDSLNAMAVQTGGTYFVDSPETHEEVKVRLQDVVTQRQAYSISFPVIRPAGEYRVEIRVVDAPGGSASNSDTVISRLQRLGLKFITPSSFNATVSYSQDAESFITTELPLAVEVVVKDGAPRDPVEVVYYANERRIGASAAVPDYAFTWDVTGLETPSDEPITRTYTLIARSSDPYLDEMIETEPMEVQIVWEGREATIKTITEDVMRSASQMWWVFPIFGILGLGLLIVVALLVRTRSQLARKVVQNTTVAIKGVTQRLGGGGALPPAAGKLVVLQGPRVGTEFRLSSNAVKIGRDPQINDFALNDGYVSNPHLSVFLEGDRCYVQDEGSTNRTRLNGVVLPPHQRQLLAPDAILELGQTRLQYKRLGGATRVLRPGQTSSGAGDQGSAPTQMAMGSTALGEAPRAEYKLGDQTRRK